jgi:hypothetical protein
LKDFDLGHKIFLLPRRSASEDQVDNAGTNEPVSKPAEPRGSPRELQRDFAGRNRQGLVNAMGRLLLKKIGT